MMWILAEISDKVGSPMTSAAGGLLVGLFFIGVTVGVWKLFKPLALIPALLGVAFLYWLNSVDGLIDKDLVPAIIREYGPNYFRDLRLSFIAGLAGSSCLVFALFKLLSLSSEDSADECRDCGYDIRGLRTSVCPECGLADPDDPNRAMEG